MTSQMQNDELAIEKGQPALRLKKRVFEIVEVAAAGDRWSKTFDLFMMTLIVLNIAALVIETVKPIHDAVPLFFQWFEVFSIAIFTGEYALRLWSCTACAEYARPMRGRLRFASKPLAVIDLLAILPFYLPFAGLDLRSLRALRLFRFFRVAKLGRYSRALQTFGRVLFAKKAELLTTLFLILVLLLFASSLMYFVENEAQPEHFSSIPAAMWWGVATLTTVGYGDICPVTPLGKFLASIIAVLGIGVFAMPTGILAVAFAEEMKHQPTTMKTCPHCGKDLERTNGE